MIHHQLMEKKSTPTWVQVIILILYLKFDTKNYLSPSEKLNSSTHWLHHVTTTYWTTTWCFCGELTCQDVTSVWAFVLDNRYRCFDTYFGICRSPQSPPTPDVRVTATNDVCEMVRSSTTGIKGLIPTYGGKPQNYNLVSCYRVESSPLWNRLGLARGSESWYLWLCTSIWRQNLQQFFQTVFLCRQKHVCESWWICNSIEQLVKVHWV